MSLNIKPLKRARAYDSRIQFSDQPEFIIERGGTNQNWTPSVAQAFDNSQFTFNVFPSSRDVIIDRKMRLQARFRVVINRTGALGFPIDLVGGAFALRSWPINNCVSTISLRLNGQQFSGQPNLFINTLSRYYQYDAESDYVYSTFPSLPDMSQRYQDLNPSAKNPLNSYQDSSFYDTGRASFQPVLINTNNNVLFDAEYVITEDVVLSPLLLNDQEDESGFTYVSEMQIIFTLGNLVRLLSIDTNQWSDISSVSVTIMNTAPQLLFRQITNVTGINDIPRTVFHNFYNVQVFQTSIGNINAGATSVQVQNNTIQLSQIPTRIYVWAARSFSDVQGSLGYSFADAFALLSNLRVNFDNRTGLLSNQTNQDLYLMSQMNGLRLSYPQWASFVGSPVCIVPWKDLGLDPLQAPGLRAKNYNLSIQADVTNISAAALNFSFYLMTVSEGVITNDGGNYTQEQGVLSESDIVNAGNLPYLEMSQIPKNVFGGANFFSGLKKNIGKVAKFIQKVLPTVQKVTAALPSEVRAIAEPLERGLEKALPAIISQTGGRKLTKSQLRARLGME